MTTVGDPSDVSEAGCTEVPEQVRALAQRLREQLRALIRIRSPRDPIGRIAPELTSAQVHAIVALGLDETPLSMSALAQRIDAALPAVTGIVDRLERDGFVERLRDDSDRRVVLVGLTDKGRTTHRHADEHMCMMLCQFLGALPDAERVTFVDSVCRAIAIVCGASSKPPTGTP